MKEISSKIESKSIAKIAAILGLVLIAVFYLTIGQKHQVDITDNVTADVTFKDGTTKHYDSDDFDLLNKGDVLVMHIALPKDLEVDPGVIRFMAYHSIITATYNDEVLYTSGQELDNKGNMIGVDYPEILIPEEAWGHSIDVEFVIKENSAYSRIDAVLLFKATEGYRIFIEGKEPSMIISISGIVIALVALIITAMTQALNIRTRKIIYIALFAFLSCCWILSSVGGYRLIGNSFFWRKFEYISLYACAMPIVAYYFELLIDKRLKMTSLIILISNLAFNIIVVLLDLMNIVHLCDVLFFAHIMLFADIVFLFVATVFMMKKEKRGFANIIFIGIMFLLVFAIMDLIRFNIVKYVTFFAAYTIPALLPIGLLAFSVSLIIAFYREIILENQKSSVLETQLNIQLEHYRSVEDRNTKLTTYRHDMKNHLVVIDSLIQENKNDEAIEYIKKLNEALTNKGTVINTNNPILDAILTQKREYAQEKGINFVLDLNISPSLRIDSLDICKIFGNIYDNAIEACEKESSNAYIKSKLVMRGDSLVFTVENSATIKPKVKGENVFTTSKEDKKAHGHGIQSVIESVEKYNGVHSFKWQSGEFRVTIMLQNVK